MLADISSVDAIYIVCGRTDMRKSIDGLCAIIQEQFSMKIDHALSLFCGRKCDRMAIVDMSTPDINKFIATECRNACGVTVFSRRLGT